MMVYERESLTVIKGDDPTFIGSAESLTEGGKGLLFEVRKKGEEEVTPAFVIRFDYQFFGYLNRCGHIAIQLDYMPGEFFSDDGQTLVCSTHGAEYAPDTGSCLGGPCFGVGLDAIDVQEKEGQLYLNDSEYEVVKSNV